MNPLTKDFSEVIQLRAPVVGQIMRAQHTAGVLRHRLQRLVDDQMVEVVVNVPSCAFQPAPGQDIALLAIVSTQLFFHRRNRQNAGDVGQAVVADVSIPTSLSVVRGNDNQLYLNIDPSGVAAGDIAVLPGNSPIAQEARDLLLEMIRRDYASSVTLGADSTLVGQAQHVYAHLLSQEPDVITVGLGDASLSAAGFTPVAERFLQSDWALAISAEVVLAEVRDSLEKRLGPNLPPPFGSSPVLLSTTHHRFLFFSYTRRTYLESLHIQLLHGFILATGELRAVHTGLIPDVGATFAALIYVELGPAQTVQTRVGQISVNVHGFFGDLANFLSGSDVESAIQSGIRDALRAPGQQGVASQLLSSRLLSDLASRGVPGAVTIRSQTTGVQVRPEGLILHGDIQVSEPSKPPRPNLHIFRPPGSLTRRLFFLGRSWAPGNLVTRFELDYGDGTVTVLQAPVVPLVLGHDYAPGAYRVCLKVIDNQGRQRTACQEVETARLELTHTPLQYEGKTLLSWRMCLSEEETDLEFHVVDGETGQPVQDAVVNLQGSYFPPYSRQQLSDAAGRVQFRVDPLQAKSPLVGGSRFPSFDLRAMKDGYLPAIRKPLLLIPCDALNELVPQILPDQIEQLERVATILGFDLPLDDPEGPLPPDPWPPITPATNLGELFEQLAQAEEWDLVLTLAALAGVRTRPDALQAYLDRFPRDEDAPGAAPPERP